MSALIRDSALGQLIRYATNNKYFLYPEEKPGFQPPTKTYGQLQEEKRIASRGSSQTLVEQGSEGSARHKDQSNEKSKKEGQTPAETEEGGQDVSSKKLNIPPETILVDWYGPNDRENPQNWQDNKKIYVAFVVSFLTTGVYMSAAIISPAIGSLIQEFGVSEVAATLTLALYVLAYGIGPLLWSPLSEMPRYGRNPFYVAPIALYVCLQIGAALTPTFAGLLIIRFITGFLGSAPLATGGASMVDIFKPDKIPYAFAAWSYGAVAGPAAGPVIAAFAVLRFDWRWSMWIILMLIGLVFVLIFVSLPETSGPNLLHRRAQRLRKLTGNPNYRTMSDIEENEMSARDKMQFYLIKPTEIAVKDPAVAYTHVYMMILYASYYLFFDAVPVVFEQRHGFSYQIASIVYLSIGVGIGLSIILYLLQYRFFVVPQMKKNGPGEPEGMLMPALIWTWFVPVGLFIFAWTSQSDTNYWGPIIGLAVYSFGVVVVFLCLFAYISTIYVRYAASVLAENDFLRSSLAAGLLLAGIPMFKAMGVQAGVSMIAGVNIIMSVLLVGLWKYGKTLRARSKFASA